MLNNVAEVRAVGLYDTKDGIVGADDSAAAAQKMEQNRLLKFPVQLSPADQEVGIVVILSPKQIGKWRSDYFEIRYRSGKNEYVEKVTAGAGLCVASDPAATACDVGKPPWW